MTIPRLTFLLDVDNTLIDNDAAKAAIDARLRDLLGEGETARFWTLYEVVRREIGMVSYPLTIARFRGEAVVGEPGGEAARRERQWALADIVMDFPYAEFLYPGALDTIAALRRIGRVVILSDGDPTYQPSKIARSGLGQAVAGYVLVYPHKEDYLHEITAIFPADHYVLVEDKPDNITKVRARLGAPLTGVLVQQGKYAAAVGPGPWPGADLTVATIGDLARVGVSEFVEAARGATVAVER